MKECPTGSDQSPPFKDERILLFKVTVPTKASNINMQNVRAAAAARAC